MKKWWATVLVLLGLVIVLGVVQYEIGRRQATDPDGKAIVQDPAGEDLKMIGVEPGDP